MIIMVFCSEEEKVLESVEKEIKLIFKWASSECKQVTNVVIVCCKVVNKRRGEFWFFWASKIFVVFEALSCAHLLHHYRQHLSLL